MSRKLRVHRGVPVGSGSGRRHDGTAARADTAQARPDHAARQAQAMSTTSRTGRPAGSPLRGAVGWARVRGRHLGSAAFLTNRVTGLLLIGYLYLHLGVLYLLTE